MSEWISVKDRLPRPENCVLVYRRNLGRPDGYVSIDYATLGHGENLMWVGDYTTWKSEVTHWMPLPEPPKGDES